MLKSEPQGPYRSDLRNSGTGWDSPRSETASVSDVTARSHREVGLLSSLSQALESVRHRSVADGGGTPSGDPRDAGGTPLFGRRRGSLVSRSEW